MQVVILAGGMGTRLAEETESRPKPMVEVGGHPLLWHILKHYSRHGFTEFLIALGYKGEMIKRYFVDQMQFSHDLTIDLGKSMVTQNRRDVEPWHVGLIDTGLSTLTGSRIRRLANSLRRQTFMVTYGDGVSDVPLDRLLSFHRSHGAAVTLTAVRPPARFGDIVFDGNHVVSFTEKSQLSEGWINGGFLVLEPEILDLLSEDGDSLEVSLLERLAREGKVAAYRHEGFWQCADTLRDLRLLRSLWDQGHAPWKTWS
jgi:glucose-1-phosphate cytidylyltransferase